MALRCAEGVALRATGGVALRATGGVALRAAGGVALPGAGGVALPGAGGLLLVLLVLLLPGSAAGQEVLSRPPNLSGGWVGAPGTVHFNFNHRFWVVRTPGEDKLVNSPTFLLAFPLPGGLMAGGQYASNSLVADGKFNEWEAFARWAPPDLGPVAIGLTAGYHLTAGSVDGELSVRAPVPVPSPLPGDSVQLLGAVRAFSDAMGEGEPGWFGGGGVVVHFGNSLSLSGDLGQLRLDDGVPEVRRVWGAGLQLRIPTTPHTFSLHAANTRTGTLQGSSVGGRTSWGFEFTVPITPARYIPALRRDPGDGVAAAAEGEVEVTMTDDLRFLPGAVEVQVGQTVVWRNTTPIAHTVTADPSAARIPGQVALPTGAEPFDSGTLLQGEIFRHTFTVPGEYLYVCLPHDQAGMVGRVIVVP